MLRAKNESEMGFIEKQFSVLLESKDSGARLPRFRLWLCHLLAV